MSLNACNKVRLKRTRHHLLLLLTKQKLKEERQPKPRGWRGEGTAPSPILPLTVDGHVAARGYEYGYELDDGIRQLEPRTQWTLGQLDRHRNARRAPKCYQNSICNGR